MWLLVYELAFMEEEEFCHITLDRGGDENPVFTGFFVPKKAAPL